MSLLTTILRKITSIFHRSSSTSTNDPPYPRPIIDLSTDIHSRRSFWTIEQDLHRCGGCTSCRDVCRFDLFTPDIDTHTCRFHDPDHLCDGLGLCVDVCPTRCIHLRKITSSN